MTTKLRIEPRIQQELGYLVVWVREDGLIESLASGELKGYRRACQELREERIRYADSDPKRCRIVLAKGIVR